MVALLGVLTLSSAPSACSSGPPACSEGPPRTSLSQKQATTSTMVGCKPRCELAHTRPPYPLAAVPSGVCDRDEYVCEMQVFDGCATHGVQCECLDDEWQCAIVLAGAAVCLDASIAPPFGPPACSEGPPRTSLEPREEKKHDGVCIPRCAVSSSASNAGVYPLAAVPSGACDRNRNEYVCRMSVRDGCNALDVQCECRNETWDCGIVRAGSNACGDGGDAGNVSDASSD